MVDNLRPIQLSFSIDQGILERHNQIEEIIGVLDIEKESLQRAELFSWIFFPIWILLAVVQGLCFILGNGRLHPLSKIVERTIEGKLLKLVKNKLIQ